MRTIQSSILASESASIFSGVASARQAAGLTVICDSYLKYGDSTDSDQVFCEKLAYVLATAAWETGRRMQPVRETFANDTQSAISTLDRAFAAKRMAYVKTPYWRDGYFGRGYVQLTHASNYDGPLRDEVLSRFPGKDIYRYPDNALDPDIAAFIMVYGMTKGTFTGHRLAEYFSNTATDWLNARRIINPGDSRSYQPIADYAKTFFSALNRALLKGVPSV